MKSPFPVTYRELWLPQHIDGVQIAPFRGDAHPLVLTGAQKRTTADGIHGSPGVNSYINCGVIHNGQAKLAVNIKFKLDLPHAAGGGNKWLWGKIFGATYLYVFLSNADGLIHFLHNEGAGDLFNLSVGTGTLNAGQVYNVLASISSANGARLRLDNGVAATNADVTAAPAGGSLVLLDYAVGVASGLRGTVVGDVTVVTDDLTAAEETDLYNGITPVDAVELYKLDEGRGTTINDRGSGGNNGTLGSACTWIFGQVRQPVLSVDGRNDYASGTGFGNGDITSILVMRAKSTYLGVSTTQEIWKYWIDANNNFVFFGNVSTMGVDATRNTLNGAITFVPSHAINDYLILTVVFLGSTMLLYKDGSLVGTSGVFTAGASALPSTIYLGSNQIPGSFDVSAYLIAATIEGALSAAQVKTYSRWLRDRFNLPISI